NELGGTARSLHTPVGGGGGAPSSGGAPARRAASVSLRSPRAGIPGPTLGARGLRRRARVPAGARSARRGEPFRAGAADRRVAADRLRPGGAHRRPGRGGTRLL